MKHQSNLYALNPIPLLIGLNIISVYNSKTVAPNRNSYSGGMLSYYCALITIDGTAIINHTDGTSTHVQKGDLCFLNHGDIIDWICTEGVWHHCAYWFQIVGVELPQGIIKINLDNEESEINKIIKLVRQATPYAIKMANSLLLKKIIYWTNLYSENEKKKKYPDSILQALSYINNHLSESLKLESIGDKIGYSKRQLQNLFIKHLGTSPRQYIIKERIKLACSFLENTNEPLEIIAETLGFSSATHFMTSFKQMMNMTPTEYRKEKFALKEKKNYATPTINISPKASINS